MQNNQLKPVIGTITACYNAAPYIVDCIDALVKQTIKPNYIVIIDDKSTDNSVEIICDKLYQLTKTNIIEGQQRTWNYNGTQIVLFLLDKNSGPAAARNIGVKYLIDKTHFCFIADADDVYYPKKIEKSMNIFLKFPHVALVYSDYDTHNMNDNTTEREYKEIFSFKRLLDECIVSNNSGIATSIFQAIGLYDEKLRGPEDYDIWLRIADIAAVYHIPEALYKYRITGNNITITTPSDKFARQVQIVKEKAKQRINARFKTNN
jgi:glycosyltransferase involved in cell wall biosynthesis